MSDNNLHVMFTMIIFFVNLMLSIFVPQYSFLATNIYETDSLGNYEYNNEVSSYLGGGLGEDSQSAVNEFGLFDVFSMLIDFFKFIINMFIALPVLIAKLSIEPLIKVFFFFPVLFMYAFAIVGWFR